MCGIAGIWKFNAQTLEQTTLQRFTDSLIHRGPDGGDYFIDSNFPLGLGHRRLSILDLSELGKQPMSFANERYWLTYNGEVFNFLELRQELEKLGHTFVSQTDTEVILAAYHEWGKDCLVKMNGMWGLAIWDTQKQELFLARDRFGIKPLYYLHIPNQLFAFASETIAFRHLEGYRPQINTQHLQINLQDIQALEGQGHTIYQNTFQVLPGHYLILKQGQSIEQKKWWDTSQSIPEIPQNYDDQVTKFKEIFQDACKIRMRSDVPLASALSGGLDSSSVYCTLHQLMQGQTNLDRTPDNWQTAYVGTFPGTTQDETRFAKQVVEHIQGQAKYIAPDYSNLTSKLLETTIKFDNLATTPLFIVSEIYQHMAQNGIKVSMDGHGVDEMLLGYPNLVLNAYHHYYAEQSIAQAIDAIKTYGDLFPENARPGIVKTYLEELSTTKDLRFYKKAITQKIKRFFPAKQPETPQTTQSWLPNHSQALIPLLPPNTTLTASSSSNEIDQVLHENFHCTTLPMILRNFDRASMQHGVEIRMPFMDWRLVTFVFGLPLSSKLGNGFTKKILRDAMQGTLPETIRTRKLKIGLNAPMPEWFNGVLQELILDQVHSHTFIKSDVWNGEVIAKFAEQKSKNNSWNWADCTRFWPYLNAHLLLDQ